MVVSDTGAMIAGMGPMPVPGDVVFCTVADAALAATLAGRARGTFAEAEGTSLILPVEVAREAGLPVDLPMRQITLSVQSALDGVGLTAAVAAALADRGICCNMVAAFHHDHVFVPSARAEEALSALRARAASAPA